MKVVPAGGSFCRKYGEKKKIAKNGVKTELQTRHTSLQYHVTSHQSPVTSHQSPVTSHQSPVTSHQSPVILYLCVNFPFFQLSVEGTESNAQYLGCLGLVAIGFFQDSDYGFFSHVFKQATIFFVYWR